MAVCIESLARSPRDPPARSKHHYLVATQTMPLINGTNYHKHSVLLCKLLLWLVTFILLLITTAIILSIITPSPVPTFPHHHHLLIASNTRLAPSSPPPPSPSRQPNH
ncbi:hypothetical protein E2C01_082509 [Portunus trituberculatus]|uniref:Uncharacterized protein n=1 Tax=Portunus trituberculatus TaxID=210409 RepID=A0A5B7J410_PORTR|nr:hypothetical protein [Portunus trituberculatus]